MYFVVFILGGLLGFLATSVSVYPPEYAVADKLCESNGGLASIRYSTGQRQVNCTNSAQFVVGELK